MIIIFDTVQSELQWCEISHKETTLFVGYYILFNWENRVFGDYCLYILWFQTATKSEMDTGELYVGIYYSLIIGLNILAIYEYEKDESVLLSGPRNMDWMGNGKIVLLEVRTDNLHFFLIIFVNFFSFLAVTNS